MSDSLAKKASDFFTKKLSIDEESREFIQLMDIGEKAIGGVLVSKQFENLNSEQQMNRFLDLLREFQRSNNIKYEISPAVLVYSPEEYRLSTREELEGVLRSVDLHTFSGMDLILSVDSANWNSLTKQIDISVDENHHWQIDVALRRQKNAHLYDAVANLLRLPTNYNWFDCSGYYFTDLSDFEFHPQGLPDLLLISFKAVHIPPWELPSSAF